MSKIRRAHEEDHDAILALWETAGLSQTTAKEWSALSSGPMSAILVAEDAGAVIGVAVATYDGWRAYIYHLAMHPIRRLEGIGHDLVAAAERYLADTGARHAYVMVSEWNTEGLALVGETGFPPEGDIVLAKRLFIPVPV